MNTVQLSLMFREGEQVCVGGAYETGLRKAEDVLPGHGEFIAINPLHTSRRDGNVTAYRNFLIELDKMPLDQQMDHVEKLGLPYTVATHSGGKSIHFVVCLEESLPDEATWRRYAQALINAVPGADPSTKNPSRFTRLTEAYREDKDSYQDLVKTGRRITLDELKAYTEAHMPAPPSTDYRKIYAKATGRMRTIHALHPMTRSFVAGTHDCRDGRNNALFKAAADYKDCEYDEAEATEVLLTAALEYGLETHEALATISNAYKRPSRH